MKYKYNGEWVDVTLNALEGMPIGSIIQFAGSVIPTGWLICDGSSLSEEEYPQLYDVIGYTYGGSGTSFNLPNFKGRVPIGQDTNDNDFNALGETGGSKELQAHSHNVTVGWGQSGADLSNYYPLQQTGNTYAKYMASGGSGGNFLSTAGSGNSGNLQPYLVVNYIIKATQTTPTFASVVNTNSNSTTDTYSCDYVNEHCGGIELFSGYESGNVTLSDSASNYSYIEVFGQKSGCYGYVKIYSPNGKQFGLAIHNAYDSNSIQQIFGRYTISGTTITKNFEVYMNNNGSPANSNDIRIEKVIGYK